MAKYSPFSLAPRFCPKGMLPLKTDDTESTYMILVARCDLCLEDKLLKVAWAVARELSNAVLLHQGQQAARVEERAQPVSRHLLSTLE